MPKLRTETVGTGDMSWLDSTHGIGNGRTVTVDISTFTAGTHFPNGYIPAGTPVGFVSAANGGTVVGPYTVAEGTTTGLGVLVGHLLTDQVTDGVSDFGAPLISHGRINVAKVPYASFAAPVAAAKRASVTIDYV